MASFVMHGMIEGKYKELLSLLLPFVLWGQNIAYFFTVTFIALRLVMDWFVWLIILNDDNIRVWSIHVFFEAQ